MFCCSCRGVFKRSAAKIAAGLLEKGFGEDKVAVVINAAAPIRGNFIVTLTTGDQTTTVVELLALKRPFTALRELDLESVVSDIAKYL